MIVDGMGVTERLIPRDHGCLDQIGCRQIAIICCSTQGQLNPETVQLYYIC